MNTIAVLVWFGMLQPLYDQVEMVPVVDGKVFCCNSESKFTEARWTLKKSTLEMPNKG